MFIFEKVAGMTVCFFSTGRCLSETVPVVCTFVTFFFTIRETIVVCLFTPASTVDIFLHHLFICFSLHSGPVSPEGLVVCPVVKAFKEVVFFRYLW